MFKIYQHNNVTNIIIYISLLLITRFNPTILPAIPSEPESIFCSPYTPTSIPSPWLPSSTRPISTTAKLLLRAASSQYPDPTSWKLTPCWGSSTTARWAPMQGPSHQRNIELSQFPVLCTPHFAYRQLNLCMCYTVMVFENVFIWFDPFTLQVLINGVPIPAMSFAEVKQCFY